MVKESKSNKETKKPGRTTIPNNLKLIYPLVLILGTVLVLTMFSTFSLNNVAEEKVIEIKELNRPANIQIITIENSACNKCVDLSIVVSSVEQNNVNVTSKETLNFDSAKAKALIEKYDIQKIPAILISGEIEKSGDMGLIKSGDVLMLGDIPPPYTDVASNKIIGLIDLIYLVDKSCADCYDVAVHKQILTEGFNMIFNSEKSIDISDEHGQELIEIYDIELVPTIILQGEISVYPYSEDLKRFFTIEDDGSYVFTNFQELGNVNYTNLTQHGVTD